jgi:hypothetical protein
VEARAMAENLIQEPFMTLAGHRAFTERSGLLRPIVGDSLHFRLANGRFDQAPSVTGSGTDPLLRSASGSQQVTLLGES